MARGMRDTLLVGVESTRGTLASSTPLTQPLVGDGFRPTFAGPPAQVRSTATYPYLSKAEAVGVEVSSIALTPDVTANTVRDLVLLATKRTNASLPSVSLRHLHESGVTGTNPQMSYLGCVCSSLRLGFSRGASPGDGALLTGNMTFGCMGFAPATGLSGSTQAVGGRFQLRASSFTINSVAYTDILSAEVTVNTALGLGPVDSSNVRAWCEEGDESHAISVTARLGTIAWRDLVTAQTEHAVAIVFATGAANETVTATMGAARLSGRTLAEQDGVLTQQIDIVPYHTGAAAPVVWTFGSSIGASVLGL